MKEEASTTQKIPAPEEPLFSETWACEILSSTYFTPLPRVLLIIDYHFMEAMKPPPWFPALALACCELKRFEV